MKTVEIEDDVYDYLRQQQTTFSGESASEVLRRLLGLTVSKTNGVRVQKSSRDNIPEWLPEMAEGVKKEIMEDERKEAVWEFVRGPQFQSERTAVGKFLSLLSFLHRRNADKFVVVEKINGRSRKYFARSESELELSGTSVHPKKIPDSAYWVVTNNSTQSKVELLLQVARLLGYSGGFAAFLATRIN